jgi:hypothetical protein
MPVDEHMHREPRLDERDRITHAPPRRQAAARAAGGSGEYDASTHGSSHFQEPFRRECLADVATRRKYPRQGFLNRSVVRQKQGFPKATSLNPTLFEGRPSPVVDNH